MNSLKICCQTTPYPTSVWFRIRFLISFIVHFWWRSSPLSTAIMALTKPSFKILSLVSSCHITVVLKNNSNLSALLRAREEFGLICFLVFFENLKIGDASAGPSLPVTWQKDQGLWDKSPAHQNQVKMFHKRVSSGSHLGSRWGVWRVRREVECIVEGSNIQSDPVNSL